MSDKELDERIIEVADEVIKFDNKIKRLCRQRKQKQLELKKLAIESWQRMLDKANEVVAETEDEYSDFYISNGHIVRI
jgi:hypothetical protein